MYRLFLILAFVSISQAQSLTQITDVIQDPLQQPVTGSCTLRLAAGHFTGPQQQQIVREPTPIKFLNGVFSAQIIPTPTGQYYVVSCVGNRGYRETGNWIVPATGSVLKLKDLWGAIPPPPSIGIPPAQITQGGATIGQGICWLGLTWGPGNCGGGAGAVPSVFGRTGAIVSAIGDYNTSQVTESGSLYFTAARARSAFSATLPLAFDSATGIFSCPTCGAGAVASVFGRTGIVVQASGDYTAAQITNAVSTAGTYSDPSWLTLTAAGGRISGFALTGHLHTGVYEPIDITLLRQSNLAGSGSATTPARSDHTHTGVYEPVITGGTTLQYFRGDKSLGVFATDALAAVTWSTLTGKPSTFAPSLHAASHAFGGGDPVTITEAQITNLTTDLAGKQPTLTVSGFFGLFGSCSGTQYPGFDGLCHTSASGGMADPGSSGIMFRTALNTSRVAGVGDIPTGYPYANLTGSPSIPAASSTTPSMDGVATVGTGTAFARPDHVHPVDTSREPALGNPATDARVLSSTAAGVRSWIVPASGGNVVLTIGIVPPVAACAAPTSANLALYMDTSAGEEWWCYATNSWKKVLSTTGVGPYGIIGQTGTAPATPAAGYLSCYFDSTSLTKVCLDSGGNATTMLRGISAVAHQFLTNVDASGIQHPAALALGDFPTAPGTTGQYVYNNAGAFGAKVIPATDLPAALSSTTSVNGTTIPASGTLVQLIGSGTFALGTASVASFACNTVSFAITGALDTDRAPWTFKGSAKAITGYAPVTAGGLNVSSFSSAGFINFDICNWTASAIVPGAVSVNGSIER